MSEQIGLEPSPKILRILGEIDYEAWQCLCEIIDNSIDSFASEAFKDLNVEPKINIILPSNSRDQTKPTDYLIIEDNAEGMTFESLSKNLKAGISNNDPRDKLGLFGMGFNIATARLGNRTEVITSTKESKEFLKVTIDFQELERSGHFFAPVERTPKKADEMQMHGTTVKITKLEVNRIRPLYMQLSIREKLGKIYGRILREKNIKLNYAGIECRPFEHCIWSDIRNGQTKNGPISAVIHIDHTLDKRNFCLTCWNWYDLSEKYCSICNESSTVVERERHIKGWVGIQRYFHESHYGIDLIRNGRIIKELDKSFFFCKDPNTGEAEKEYPVDGFQDNGRIVGELEIDFVKVTQHKNAFDETTQGWRDVVSYIRGAEIPIRPRLAVLAGYSENTSPIAQLFSAFRNSKAGIQNLVPKNSEGHAILKSSYITELIKGFQEGREGYHSDEKWWELVNKKYTSGGQLDDFNDPSGGNPFGSGAELVDDNPTDGPSKEELKTETDTNLSQTYTLDLYKNIPIKVFAEVAQSGTHKDGFIIEPQGSVLDFTYWPKASIFHNNLLQPADILINELAYHFHSFAQSELSKIPISVVELALIEKYFPYLRPTLEELRRQVRIFIDELIEHFKFKIPDFKINVSVINKSDLEVIRKKLAQNDLLDDQKIEEAIQKGEFMSYASFNALKALMYEHPQLVFDGTFFKRKWTSKKISPTMQEINQYYKNEMLSLLNDIHWFNENNSASPDKLWRGRIKRLAGSLEILTNWRA